MRTSPVYYIAPSSISIIPNCNGTTSDLAVTIARGTKLKVYYPSIFALGTVDGNYQEWTLAGRNRRLADSTAPYTIYARLRMAEDPTSAASLATAHANGYLIFAKQTKDAEGNWIDPYILSPNPSPTSPLNNVMGANGKKYSWPPIPAGQAQNGRTGYWWLKLGVVSVPENGKRTVTLDTGILDTAQYNEEWKVNPDDLPVRPVRDIQVDRKEWTTSPKDTYTGETGSTAPDGTLDMDVASKLGWTGTEVLSFTQGQEIDEPYHYRSLTRNRWLTQRLDIRNSGYNDKELYERLTSPARGWEEENWVETSRVWHNSSLWECQKEGTTDEPSEDSAEWRLLMRGGADGEDGDSGYSVELTKSSDSAIIDPSGNVVGGYRTVSIGKDDNGLPKEFYSYRFFTSAAVMKGGEYLHLCGAMDDDEELGEGNFTIEAIGAGCDLKMEGTTCYITGIWHCNDGNAETPNTSYSENPEEYQLMRAMTECVAHITLNIEGKTAVTKDYRLQLVHLPTDTVVIESHNEVAAVNWSTKKNAWTNPDSIVIPLTASSGGQPVRFQTVNGEEGPDIRILNKPTWLEGFSLAWADYKDGTGNVLYPASQHMAVEITIPIANIKKNDDIKTSNLLRFNVVTTVDGVEYENIVPFTLNMTTDKAVYVLVPSVRQVVGTMIGGTWDEQAKDVANARYSYTANGASCNNVSCRLMSYDENNALTEITNASDIHDNVTFLLNGQPSSLAAFRAGLSNTAVAGKDHNLFDELSEIVFAIRLDDNDYESEGVPILRNGAQLTVGSDGYWYIGGVKTEVFAKGTEVTDTKIYYTDPMTGSTPPPYSPEDDQRGLPVSPYLKTECPAAVEGKFIHYVSITVFSDSDKTFVYSYGTIGTGNTITVIHDRDYYASSSELKEAQLKAIEEWSESTPADYSATNKYLYSRDTARYYKNGAEQIVTVGGIAYPKTVYTLLSYWGQDGSGVEFAYYRADDDSAANKPSVSVLNQRHPGTAKNPVIADWSGSDGGWYDDNPGFTTQGQVMYQSVNKYSNGQWSGWGDPVIIDRYAQNGKNGDVPMQAFQWNQSATEAPSPLPSGANLGAWRPSAPNSPGDGYFLWMTQTIKHTAQDGTVTYDQWSPAVRISGDTGPAGEDGADGYGLTLTPAQLIFEEKLGSDGQTVSIDYINNTVTAVVQKGKTPLTPTIIKVETSDSYSGCDLTKITISGGTITMTSGSITLASGASAGHFTVNINADNDAYDQNVRINFYVNRLGTFTRTINGDIETAKGEMKRYTANKDSAVRHDYAVAIETSAKGLTQQFTEQISRAGDYGRNLFGFHKGANISLFAPIPFIQGYGLIVTSNNSNVPVRRQGRVSNLGFENVGGYFVVTFMAKTNADFTSYPNQQYAKVRVDLCDVEPIHNIGSIGDNINIAVNNNWKSYEYHFFLPEGISYMSPDSYNGFIDFEEAVESGITPIITNQGAYIYIRHLKIERGQTATKFCEADEDIAYLGHGNVAKNLDFESYRTEDKENQTVDGRSGVYQVRVPNLTDTYPWSNYTTFRDYLYKDDIFNLEAGKCYTLSFWAKSSVDGFIITQHLYKDDYSIINTVGVDLYVDPSNGTIQESIVRDGQTQIKLSTTWTQYFVHFYVVNNVPSAKVIPLRVLKSYNNDSSRNLAYIYMSDIELQEGYVTSTDYFASFISQNARRISLVQQSGTKLAGIDIQSGMVNLMGDKVTFSNSTGTVSGKVWIDPDDGTIHAINGNFRGEITATSGTIGGFTIDPNRLYNSNWNAGIDIDTNDGRIVKIGKNAQGVMDTESAIIRAENTRTGQSYNTALYLNAQNGDYNYAFYGVGNGVLNGLMFGYKVQLFPIPSGNDNVTTELYIKNGSTIILNGSHGNGHVWLTAPKLSDVRQCLGINSSTTPFAIEFTVVSHAQYEFVHIAFRNAITETQNSEYPWLMNTDDAHDDDSIFPHLEKSVQIAQGDVVKILLLYDNVGTENSPKYEYRAYDLIRRV